MAIANMRCQECLWHCDLTPTMDEQDEINDKEFLAEANTSPPCFTASQKNKGHACVVVDSDSSAAEDEGDHNGEDEGDYNEEPNGEPLAVESLGKFINKKAKDATDVACLLQMVPSCKSRPDNKDLDCESQGSGGDYMPEPPKEKLAQSCSDANGVFELVDEDEADDELAATLQIGSSPESRKRGCLHCSSRVS